SAVLVVDTSVARAHEEPRLRKPLHRTAQMGAVHHEDLEAVLAGLILSETADIDGVVGGHTIPALAQWVVEGRVAGLARRIFGDRPKVHPRRRFLAYRPQEVQQEWDRERHQGQQSNQNRYTQEHALEECPSVRLSGRCWWFISDVRHCSIPHL